MRRSRSNRDKYLSVQRDHSPIANDTWSLLDQISAVRSPLKEVEDRRLWRPEPLISLRTLRSGRHRLTAPPLIRPRPAAFGRPLRVGLPLPAKIMFRQPEHLVLCVRRKQRREVLFAKLKTGKGARARRKRTSWSNIACR